MFGKLLAKVGMGNAKVDRSFSGDGTTSISYPSSVQEGEIENYFEQVFPA